jgi:hypothetical protein
MSARLVKSKRHPVAAACFLSSAILFFPVILDARSELPPTPAGALSPANILQTGGGEPLITAEISLDIPPASRAPRLEFEVGFATAETEAFGLFLDSLSVTLQRVNQTATALLLTLDLHGPVWAPFNPGGFEVSPGQIVRTEQAFDPDAGNFDVIHAYSISMAVPEPFTDAANWLFFDLFDNGNDKDSFAYFDKISLSHDSTPYSPQIGLQSSASPHGPFASEDGVTTNEIARTLRLPQTGVQRFFRLRSEAEVRIARFTQDQGELVCRYEFSEPRVTLLGAAQLSGPFTAVAGAVVDMQALTVTAPGDASLSFYRLEANARTRIAQASREGDLLVFRFDFQPAQLILQSSAQLDGPYADEQNSQSYPQSSELRLAYPGAARFYRMGTDDARELIGVEIAGDDLLFRYRSRGTALVVQSAPEPNGPYEDEPGAEWDEMGRAWTIHPRGGARFYRLRGDIATRIHRIDFNPEKVTLRYE